MSQHRRIPGSVLLVAAILVIPTIMGSIAYAVQKADAKCMSVEHQTAEERKLCE